MLATNPYRTSNSKTPHIPSCLCRYFQTLQLLSVTFFLSGLCQAQAVGYYRSPTYSNGQVSPLIQKTFPNLLPFLTSTVYLQPGVPGMLKGSAVCTRHDIVCLDSECLDIGTTNLCHMSQLQAYTDLGNILLILILFSIVSLVQNRVSRQLDDSMQTAADYSVS